MNKRRRKKEQKKLRTKYPKGYVMVNGKIVGEILSVNPMTISGLNHIEPIEFIPSSPSEFSISCERIEVWNDELMNAFRLKPEDLLK